MAGQLNYTTSGLMTITLQGLQFGNPIQQPSQDNVKSSSINPTQLVIDVANMNQFSGWGRIELLETQPGVPGTMIVTIDSDTLGWYGTAQFSVVSNGQTILSDNFQSGVRGPLGDPKASKTYHIDI